MTVAKKKSATKPEAPVRGFKDKRALEDWLEKNHNRSDGFWLRIARKGSGKKSVTYPEAVEAALAFGWIDGQKRPESDVAWLQKLTPRRKRSIWSKINCEKVKSLIANGSMRPAGLAEVERAKQDGRWEAAYDSQRTSVVPPDFEQALAASPNAKANFAAISSANRYAILWRIQTAKKAETRERRIQEFVKMLEKGRTLH